MATDLSLHDAFLQVRREHFLPEAVKRFGREDRPLDIGHGQTTSQPSLIALMVEQLALTPSSRVLEVGTGCGYQTALLARLSAEVFSVEVIEPLMLFARENLRGETNVALRIGDGATGWPEAAPFDAIVVCAAARAVPLALMEQLAVGGRLVIPVGEPNDSQLMRVTRVDEREWKTTPLISVRFVPLVRR